MWGLGFRNSGLQVRRFRAKGLGQTRLEGAYVDDRGSLQLTWELPVQTPDQLSRPKTLPARVG